VLSARDLYLPRSLPPPARACLDCHRRTTPALVADWASGAHARAGVSCQQCHMSEENGPGVSRRHFAQYQGNGLPGSRPQNRVAVTAVVTPRACGRCHPDQVRQFAASPHARARLRALHPPRGPAGLPSPLAWSERDCAGCHGSEVILHPDGSVAAGWPNQGMGRLNPDGSRGICYACHPRHRLAKADARRPRACRRCHAVPHGAQWQVYRSSAHGVLWAGGGKGWSWQRSPLAWDAAAGYRAPTCASCHLSGVSGRLLPDHDVSQRLSWHLAAPTPRRRRHWRRARTVMQAVCRQCHAAERVRRHYTRLDRTVAHFTRAYLAPAGELARRLQAAGRLEGEAARAWFRLWHRFGPRLRMGAAMAAPDYTWWQGYYPAKGAWLTLRRAAAASASLPPQP